MIRYERRGPAALVTIDRSWRRNATESAAFGCAERRWGLPLIDGGTQRLRFPYETGYTKTVTVRVR